MEFQVLASSATCTYLRESVGTLLYLSIHGVQGVIMINVMLMIVHAQQVLAARAEGRHCRTLGVALPHSPQQSVHNQGCIADDMIINEHLA
jgi:hypothetical protein